jgi:stalled ribosome rescue protein Dom34
MSHLHAVVWLDHREAKVVDFNFDDKHVVNVHHRGSHRQVHHKAGAQGSGHAPEDQHYFDAIVTALGDAREVLITGPGTAKAAFRQHLDHRHPTLARRVVGVETLDHPTEGQLLDFARRHFKRIDAMLGDDRG